jgi:hypothetical protein
MKCAHCSNLDTTTHERHAALGFGQCKVAPIATFVSLTRDRECSKFKQASEQVIEARRTDWNNRKKGKK